MPSIRWKLILKYPILKLWSRKAKKILRKSKKMPERFDATFKYNWILKKSIKFNKLFKLKVNVHNYDNLPYGACVLVPNHQSFLDVSIIIEATKKQTYERDIPNKRIVFLAKKELLKNRKVKNYAMLNDTFFIDRSKIKESLSIVNELGKFAKQEKIGMVIFPEGKRSKDGTIGEFKAGAFLAAKKYFLPIVPVTINGAFNSTNLSRSKKKNIDVIFHKPIKPLKFINLDNNVFAKRVKSIVESSFIVPKEKKSNKKEKF